MRATILTRLGNLARRREDAGREQGAAFDLALDDRDAVDRAIHWADPQRLQLHVPTERCMLHGAFAYAGGWNPLVAAVEGGPPVLRRFYERHRPRDLLEMHLVDGGGTGDLPGPWVLPWLYTPVPRPPAPEGGLTAGDGASYYGPCTEDKIAYEVARLEHIAASVDHIGFQPDRFGDVRGCLLVRGDQHRFFIRGGKHRAAVLAARGHRSLRVTFHEQWPRAIDVAGAARWPLVESGLLDHDLATAVFDRYFDSTGREQHDALGMGLPS